MEVLIDCSRAGIGTALIEPGELLKDQQTRGAITRADAKVIIESLCGLWKLWLSAASSVASLSVFRLPKF